MPTSWASDLWLRHPNVSSKAESGPDEREAEEPVRRTRGGSGGDAAPLPQRRHPVNCLDDPDLLSRVADRLRALDERRLAGLGRLN
jgi:hypothetical protein